MTTQTKDSLHHDVAQELQLHAVDYQVLQLLHRATNSRYLLEWDHENETAQEHSLYIADMIQDMRKAMTTNETLKKAVNFMRWEVAREKGEHAKKAVWDELHPDYPYESDYINPRMW